MPRIPIQPRRRAGTAAATTALIALLAVPLAAHDFWLQPSSFTPAADTVVRLQLRVGDDYPGEPIARNAANIEAFFVHGPDGRRPIAGQNGMDPAGLLRVTTPSTYLVGYRSRQVPVNLAAPAFEQYLKEEGLENIIALRAKNNQTMAPGRERFSRSVKSLLHVGGSPPAGHDTVLGLTLELVPETHPSMLPGDGRMGFQLLYEGRPLEGALVVAIPQASAGRADGARRQARTSRDGRVRLSLAEGPWTVKTVHMVAAREGSGVDWESIWASLTFNASAASAESAFASMLSPPVLADERRSADLLPPLRGERAFELEEPLMEGVLRRELLRVALAVRPIDRRDVLSRVLVEAGLDPNRLVVALKNPNHESLFELMERLSSPGPAPLQDPQ